MRYEIFDVRESGRVLTARASTTCVTFDFTTDRPRRLTAEEREILAGFSDS